MRLLSVVTIDDEAYVHEGLDAIMDWERVGYAHVGSALNGEEGFSLVSNLRPDVILTDIRMPAMNGLELIARVRRMSDYHPAFIVISGYDEFEYARAALRHQVDDYLLKPIDEQQLEEQLLRIRTRIEAETEHADSRPTDGGAVREEPVSVLNTAVRRLLSGERAEEVLRLADRRLTAENATSLVLAVFLPVDAERSVLHEPLAATEIRYALAASKARESLDWVVSEPYGGVATLLQTNERNEALTLWIRGLYHSVADRMNRALLLAVSSPFSGARGIAAARQELQHLFISRHLADRAGCVIAGCDDSSAVNGPPANPGHSAPPNLESVVDAVERIDVEAAVAAVREGFDRLATQRPSSNALRDYVTEIRAQGDRLILDLDGSPSDHVEHAKMRSVARNAEYVPLAVMTEASVGFVRVLTERVAELRQAQRHTAVALLKRRADRRFAEDLSITQFAEQHGMNAVYLGQLFRRQLGQGFKDYLRSRRIREARRLLRDTDLLVPEIAQMVGYRDADHFTDQFKREMDLTPAAFRAQSSSRS
ncbi:MAG: response regulator transcription factor [Spirochaetota bacterium]